MYVFFDKRVKNCLKNVIKLGKKVSNSIQKGFHSEHVYNKKYLKTKIKPYEGKITTNFSNNKIPKEGSQCTCLSVILIDLVYRTNKNCSKKSSNVF